MKERNVDERHEGKRKRKCGGQRHGGGSGFGGEEVG